MKLRLNNKIKLWLKVIFILIVLGIVVKEFSGIIGSFNSNTFSMYASELTFWDIVIVLALGLISFVPLTFYDLVLKKKIKIKLKSKKLYKYSWIASSVSSMVGFGGASAIALKSHFYGKHVKDKNVLVKEISKNVALNLTGFSMVCFVYTIFNVQSLKQLNLIKVAIVFIGMYLPILVIYLIYKYFKYKDKEETIYTFKIIFISLSEWITTVTLIYGILVVLGCGVSLFEIFPIFVSAVVVAMISMVPSGIGTFDLTLLIGLEKYNVPSEKVLLAIVLYRFSYYLVPLIIGAVMYLHESYKKIDDDLRNTIESITANIFHFLLICLVLLAGSVLLLSEAVPGIFRRIALVHKIFDFSIIYISKDLSIIIGFLLIAVSMAIIYKSKKIYKLTIILVVLGAVLSLIKGFDYEEAIYLTLVAIALLLSKKRFYREGFIMTWGRILRDFIILLFFQGVYLTVAYLSLHGLTKRFSILAECGKLTRHHTIRVLVISCVGFCIALAFLGILHYLSKFNKFPKMELSECEDKVKAIFQKYKGTQVSHYIFLKDKFVYINKDNDVMLQYQMYADKIIILGNPVGDESKFFEFIQEFYDLADTYGYTPVFTAIDSSMIPYLHSTGYQFIKLGEDANVDIRNDFTLEGSKRKTIRNAVTRAEKQEYTFSVVHPPFTPDFIDQIKSVSDEWLGGRKEKGFSIGFFDEDYLSRGNIAIIKDKNSIIKGFANIIPMYDKKETLSIDLMRFSKCPFNGVMDFMFVNLFKYGKENGYSKFNMGMAPLSNVGISKYSFTSEKVAYQVYLHGQHFYSFKGLKKFKEKYADTWENRYMAYRRNTSLIFTMIQTILLVSKVKKTSDKKTNYICFNKESKSLNK
ncbi:bifunctional lysylphosphatidylglycerol flippase/synthetase MprF [Clostridium gasigenes]|uniref:bifunctional lysylphosphatidylglycerol flippase/synthetase MprF n=1 Tax=Clostridium gasigenes TaxID=94869 RepID=UPI001C0DF6F7|nr:bifunctional lysylphosphatidylglycerol flippase/synthetase MprF [Clostridium gasigenes]MBU3107739.1 bifunctional lysylphosphatidylglycerol flippase/synthetase MprF [Clostridium gasigenes]